MSDKMTASPSSGVIQPDFLVSFMLLSTVGAVLFVSLGLPWGGGAKLKSSVYCLFWVFFCLVFISPRAYVRLSHPLAPLCLSLTHTYTLWYSACRVRMHVLYAVFYLCTHPGKSLKVSHRDTVVSIGKKIRE